MASKSSTAGHSMTHSSKQKSPNCLTACINWPMGALEFRWTSLLLVFSLLLPSFSCRPASWHSILSRACFLSCPDSMVTAGAIFGRRQSVYSWADHGDAAQQAERDVGGCSEEARGGLCHLRMWCSLHDAVLCRVPHLPKFCIFFHRSQVFSQTLKDVRCLMLLKLQGWTVFG